MWIKIQGIEQKSATGFLSLCGIEMSQKKGYVIVHECEKCGQSRKNKAAVDDDMDRIIEVSVAEF